MENRQQAYSSKQVSKILGISLRQLQYWDEKGLLKPSIIPASGRGTLRYYSFSDLVQLKLIKRFRDEQISLRKIARAIEYLQRQIEEGQLNLIDPFTELSFVTDGKSIYLLTEDKKIAISLVLMGQLVWHIPLENLITEVKELESRAGGQKTASR
ncbi:MAG: MerR family transcriptional regulator [Firmicutes bacterium]|nr:MerR family transcriptional regulator [Bacillota bacterium]